MNTDKTEFTVDILKDYIPHQQLAAALNISLKTLENMNKQGEGPPRVKLGRCLYYHVDAVKTWLRTREKGKS